MTKTWPTLTAAKSWKREIDRAFEVREMSPSGRMTFRDVGERWLAAAAEGTVLTRSATLYRPSTLNSYRQNLRHVVFRELGDRRLDQITEADVRALAGKVQRKGLTPMTAHNVVVPVRAIYRWAHESGWTTRNPARVTIGGVSRSRRDGFATAEEAAALLEALPERDRALWATAVYAGLRRGELMALRWSDVDLASGVIAVRRSYDPTNKTMGEPKSEAGKREVPIIAQLARYLLAHHARRGSFELVFARGNLAGAPHGHRGDPHLPFADKSVLRRARVAWDTAGLRPIGLHEGRHSFASMLLATRTVDMKTTSALIGHSSIQLTMDTYSHLLPDARANAMKDLERSLRPPTQPTPDGVVSLTEWSARKSTTTMQEDSDAGTP